MCVCVCFLDWCSVSYLPAAVVWRRGATRTTSGLNGLEFYDQDDQKIPLSDNSILMNTHTHTHTHTQRASIKDPTHTPLNKTERTLQLKSFSLTCHADISAFPDSVNVLSNVCGDVRTPDKLIDGGQ